MKGIEPGTVCDFCGERPAVVRKKINAYDTIFLCDLDRNKIHGQTVERGAKTTPQATQTLRGAIAKAEGREE